MVFLQNNMGCGGSRTEKGLTLPAIGTKFTSAQLDKLNYYFSNLIDQPGSVKEPDEEGVTVLIERLIQRLVCGVGMLDKRFSSKFLINLEPQQLRPQGDRSVNYLVRLDCLSEPWLYSSEADSSCQVEEATPAGFARVRPAGPSAITWSEFLSPQGFLRRDKVQERFVELLAQSAAKSNLVGRPVEVDESRLPASPGKVLDPDTAFALLHVPSDHHIFLSPVENQSSRFPDPRKFRIAIVEGCSCIRLRVGLMYSTDGIETDHEVTLVLGIGFTSWPTTAVFPGRINLCHIDCLLYHQAASTGFYLVPAGPQPSARCEERCTLWQIRFPAAEATLAKHYRSDSTPTRTLAALRAVLTNLRASPRPPLVISDYMLKTVLWWRLEEEGSSIPETMKQWTYDNLALHVLTLIDRLVNSLRTQRLNSYFINWFNVMTNCSRGGLALGEEMYTEDADALVGFVRRLGTGWGEETEVDPWARADAALVSRWADVLTDLSPPVTTRSRRLSFNPLNASGYSTIAASQYSLRQLDYIGQILRSVLNVRSLTLSKANGFPPWGSFGSKDCCSEVEDIIYLLTTILDQARQLSSGTLTTKSSLQCSFRRTNKKKTKMKSHIECYDRSVALFLDEIRNTKHTADFTDDNAVVREVLKWLYLALDKDRKVIGAVLRPYLAKLFSVSHENCWHMVEWRKRQNNDELDALGKFASLVAEGKITINEAIIDAYNKGWSWADGILKTVKQLPGGLEVILTPEAGKVIRCRLNPNIPVGTMNSTRSLGRSQQGRSRELAQGTLTRHTKPLKECLQSRLEKSPKESEFFPLTHTLLRTSSPVTCCIESSHRYGTHRGLGTIVHALLNLKKFTILQEVSGLLPEVERSQVLDDIQRVSREARRPRRHYHTVSSRRDVPSTSTYRSSSADGRGTLMDTCRAARRRQPSPAVTDPCFFEPPAPPTAPTQEMMHVRASLRKPHQRNDVVTKL